MYRLLCELINMLALRLRAIHILKYFTFTFLLVGLNSLVYAQNVPDLIFVQIPAESELKESQEKILYTPTDQYVENARIVKLSAASSHMEVLTPEFYAACDPDISFDGKIIIFSAKKELGDRWQIWRMNSDGSHKEQITNSNGDCIAPVYAGNRFYLDDPQPTPQIIYAGTAHGWKNKQEPEAVFALYGMDPEGKSTHRLTYNLHSDFSPDILPNGRIVFSSWQYYEEQSVPYGRFALMAINNDGTDLMPFYGNHEMPVYKDMIHISDFDTRIYFIESDRLQWLGGGDIAYLSQRRPLHSYRKLSHESKGMFHSPCPLPDGGLLASFRLLSPNAVFSIYLIDPQSGLRKNKIFEETGWHSIDVQLLLNHPTVKGRSNWLIPGSEHGVFYCLDSYRSNRPDLAQLEPGAIKYIRVIEGIPSTAEGTMSDSDHNLEGEDGPDLQSYPTYSLRCILGVAPVENDGSFHIRVPAGVPLRFQLLDQNYMTVRQQQTWTWVMGNENRGCIGCHEDPEMSPPNIMVSAVIKPAVPLTLPAEKRRTVDFRHQIAPVIASKCMVKGCHSSGSVSTIFTEAEDHMNDLSSRKIYDMLLRPDPNQQDKYFIIPGSAKASPLIWHIFGKRFDERKKDYGGATNLIKSKINLESNERILFIEWIDLGAHWDLKDAWN